MSLPLTHVVRSDKERGSKSPKLAQKKYSVLARARRLLWLQSPCGKRPVTDGDSKTVCGLAHASCTDAHVASANLDSIDVVGH